MLVRLPKFDRLDARLIAYLRQNPRVGLLEVARQLGVARGTVQARLAKLESSGVITGHGPEIDPQSLGYSITAFVLIELAQGRLGEAVAVMEAMPEVLEADGEAVGAVAASGENDDPFGLTPRERQVLALIAEGATNRQIGKALYMAEKTASVHVSRILSKLGVKSRTQAAAVAHRQHLD